ncbi:alpha-2-macroglobulin family protein [Rubritepida flocculans]|uniref:alpha-2-macroglobulin family protein n=1 Tax=Rubritepida flocculans TaxID=182403 RepID=UPI00040D9A60|nr:alpha-2-macroglobulin [Rubritepida flocculans]
MFRRWLAPLLLLAALIAAPPAGAFDLPGLAADSQNYRAALERRFPAGGTAQQRQQAEARAQQAERANNWPAAAQAWEERAGMGEASAAQWLALARAQLRRSPPEAQRALSAAWQAFMMVPAGPPEIPSLLVIAEALGRLDRPQQQIAALEAVVQRNPAEPRFQRQLAEARRAAGLLVARLTTEPEAEPARACLGFTVPPARRQDWNPADWVRADPPLPGLAVTRERDFLCIAGLPHGRSTRILLRAGLPGEEGLRLHRDTALTIAMPDRAPRLVFDSRAFLMPATRAEARVPLALMNVSAVALRIVRITERNLVPLSRDWRLGEALDFWMADEFHETWGRVVWQGSLEVPPGEANRFQRLSVPVPEAVRAAGPGLYVMVARAADGAPGQHRTVTAQPLILTDLGLTAWRGEGGLAVQARRLSDARPAEGVRVALMARNNDILAEAASGPDGLVRFPAPLLRGEGPMQPVALHAMTESDLVALDLEAAAFDLSDRGAEGRPHPGPLDAFLWLDRGIYRPGETVQAMALLRDGGGAPSPLPLRLRLRRPNGQVAAEHVLRDGGHWPIALPPSAPAGAWRIEALADPAAPPVGEISFRVDAFLPERLAVEAGPAPGPLTPGRPLAIPVTARFLYGAPGAQLQGSAELRLVTVRSPFPELAGFRFGLEEEGFAPDLITLDLPETDADGRSTLSLALPRAPDTTRPLRGELTVLVEEPGGRASRASLDIAVTAQPRLIGIRAPEAVDAGGEAGFEIVMTDAEGRPQPGEIAWRLLRERPDWRVVVRGGAPRYETIWTDEPVDSGTLTLGAGPARLARTLPFGRYRFEAQQQGGMALASVRLRAGWVASESAETPDKVDVAADRRAYAPGETVRLRITPPFAGRAALAILTDRLIALRELELPESGAEVELPADPAWGAGAYVAVTVFRPGEAASMPGRALGLAWVQMDPAARRLALTLGGPERARPNSRVDIPVAVQGAGGPVRLTLAAVDEGILRLTRFASPDPVAHYSGRRRLGVDIRDDYGRLIAPPEGAAAVLRQGGDEMDGLAALAPPQRVVALFSGVVETDADGRALVPLDLPDFAGELRLMAVAWTGERTGAAARALTVRDPVLAEPLLPRFLAPGDEAQAGLLLHNLELPAGEVAVSLSAEGAIRLAGPARIAARLATGQRAEPRIGLIATGPGEGVLRLSVTGPEGFSASREARLAVRPARGLATALSLIDIPPGGEARLAPDGAGFLPGWRAVARLGPPVRYDAEGMLAALLAFPFGCVEQSASQALALAAALNEGSPVAERARLQRAVEAVLAKQRFDGGFGLWSAQGEAEPWASAYAVEALWRARAAGAAVPEAALESALAHLAEALEEGSPSRPEEFAAQAARLHALSLAGRHRLGAARRLLERLERLPTPLARAQLAASFARAGDMERAERAFAAALADPARRDWLADHGSAARDALALLVLAREAGLPAAQQQTALERLPGPEFTPALASTQEQAWAVLAAATLGRDGRPVRAALDGRPLAGRSVEVTGGGVLRNLGDAPLPMQIALQGIPREAAPAARQQMSIRRRFVDLNGMALNLDTLRVGQQFLLVLDARAESGQEHMAMLSQGLPAGWEIVARYPAGPVPGFPGLGELSEADAQPALDDRFAAAVTFAEGRREARLAVRIRVVTAGRFELPGAEVQDMYRPAFFARQAAGRITIQGAP